MSYSTRQTGSKYSATFKTYVTKDGRVISPFHDIPLRSGEYINCVNEIPRFEHAKFEICKEEAFNPIKQDVKKGKMRFIDNIFPFYGYPFNYGAIPQTWEDPAAEDPECKALGDNDPVDIVDIGASRKHVGQVYQAKILGALALLDDGEADWKILVIDSQDPMCEKVNDIEDVRRHFPGLLKAAFTWFRDYKIPTGKPQNAFAFEGKFLGAPFARAVVERAHESWRRLVTEGYKDVSIRNSTHRNTKGYLEEFAVAGERLEDSDTPETLFHYSYVSE
jgi:inorganic pyrophosphatase